MCTDIVDGVCLTVMCMEPQTNTWLNCYLLIVIVMLLHALLIMFSHSHYVQSHFVTKHINSPDQMALSRHMHANLIAFADPCFHTGPLITYRISQRIMKYKIPEIKK